MMRYGNGGRRLVLAFGLMAACAASYGTGDGAAAHRLVIDPGTFIEMPSGTPFKRASRSLGGPVVELVERGLGEPDDGFESASRSLMSAPPVGPRIELRRPGDASVFREDEPVSVHVEFLPAADGVAPDMETLKVKVRKGWFGKDITDKVEPYVEGAAVRVPEVDFSGHTGDFRFEIHIRDARGRPGEAQFRVTIRS